MSLEMLNSKNPNKPHETLPLSVVPGYNIYVPWLDVNIPAIPQLAIYQVHTIPPNLVRLSL